jgi:peptidyl-prolyl cis-trans isomerase C
MNIRLVALFGFKNNSNPKHLSLFINVYDMYRILKEPLIHFLLLGGLIFFMASFVYNKNRKDERTIVINNEKIGNIIRLYTVTAGAPPNKTQLDAMIEDYIREEIFYRESLKMRLDKDDEIIRRRLSQKMEFLQSDLSVVAPPTQKQLEDFYHSHPENFMDSGAVSFTHIYFSADKKGAEEAQGRAQAVKAKLMSSGKTRAPELGDPFSLQFDYTGQNKLDIVQLFGQKPIEDSLFKSPLDKWIGPVESGYGWHLIRIYERKQTRIPPFESVKDKVRDDYIATMKDSLNKVAFEKLKRKYAIQRDYLNYNE